MSAPPATDTLEEPVHVTILRDVKAIGRKMAIVAIPMLGGDRELRDWDLYGPLALCLILAMVLGNTAAPSQGSAVFSAVFLLIWVGAGVVTLNAKFLGANLSFFQTVCTMGYCVTPLCVAAIVTLFIPLWFVRLILDIVAWAWACWASLRFFRGSVRPEREVLTVYPIALFFFFITWMMVVGI